jgi:hypothetical protein
MDPWLQIFFLTTGLTDKKYKEKNGALCRELCCHLGAKKICKIKRTLFSSATVGHFLRSHLFLLFLFFLFCRHPKKNIGGTAQKKAHRYGIRH